MKGIGRIALASFAALALAPAAPAGAQDTAAAGLPQADLSGFLGWQHTEKAELGSYGNDWHNAGLHAGGAAGWYWTEHLKTEIDAGASARGRIYGVEQVAVDGRPVFVQTEQTFATRRIGAVQHYQFFRNAWFHPYVAAGGDITWETARERRDPLVFYGPSGDPREVAPASRTGPHTQSIVRPIAALGFKAYMTPRSYFRTDLRLAFRGGVDEVIWRVGFGVDVPHR